MSNLITDEIRSWIGRSDAPVKFEVSRRDIIKYSHATEQLDEKFLAGDVAPPMFLFAADRPLTPPSELGPDGLKKDNLLPDLPLKRVMAGGVKHVYYQPIHPGDELEITRTIADIYEKQGSSGPLIFVVYHIDIRNAAGEPVMREIQSRIVR